MISRIDTGNHFSALDQPTREALDADILQNYPYPLSVSFANVLNVSAEPLARLSVLVKDLISTLLQYLALLMLHDYASSSVKRSFRLFTAIESMVYMAGPGKWLGFLREARKHYAEVGATPSLPGLFEFIDRHCIKGGTRLRLIASDGETGDTLPTLEALVTLRNRWAHSKHMTEEDAKAVGDALLLVLRHLYRDLAFLKGFPLLATVRGGDPVPLCGSHLPPELASATGPIEVLMGSPAGERPLLRLFIHRSVTRKQSEILLFEELVEERQAVFSSSFHGVRLSKSKPDERPIWKTSSAFSIGFGQRTKFSQLTGRPFRYWRGG